MCNKASYESKQQALKDSVLIGAFAKHFNRHSGKSRKGNKTLRPYPCNYCGKWHLTSAKKRKWQ